MRNNMCYLVMVTGLFAKCDHGKLKVGLKPTDPHELLIEYEWPQPPARICLRRAPHRGFPHFWVAQTDPV